MKITERMAAAIKAEIGRQMNASPLVDSPPEARNWSAVGDMGVIDLLLVANAALEAALADDTKGWQMNPLLILSVLREYEDALVDAYGQAIAVAAFGDTYAIRMEAQTKWDDIKGRLGRVRAAIVALAGKPSPVEILWREFPIDGDSPSPKIENTNGD